MFFLVLEEASFPITFPVSLVTGVSMNESLRQPIEFTQPKVIKYSLPFVFMQLAPPVYLANGLPVSNPTSTTTSDIGVGRTSTEPV